MPRCDATGAQVGAARADPAPVRPRALDHGTNREPWQICAASLATLPAERALVRTPRVSSAESQMGETVAVGGPVGTSARGPELQLRGCAPLVPCELPRARSLFGLVTAEEVIDRGDDRWV